MNLTPNGLRKAFEHLDADGSGTVKHIQLTTQPASTPMGICPDFVEAYLIIATSNTIICIRWSSKSFSSGTLQTRSR
eukprot:COSAG06_NODE_4169_length_4504_cov_125.786606_5_plen_77_part_00